MGRNLGHDHQKFVIYGLFMSYWLIDECHQYFSVICNCIMFLCVHSHSYGGIQLYSFHGSVALIRLWL